MDTNTLDRFCTKYTKDSSGCWLWVGAKFKDGYGAFRVNRPRKQIRAHRAAWILYKGEIPEGLHVLHKCDIRSCVNPDHLFLGTNLDNIRDRQAKGRSLIGEKNHQRQKTHCPQGHEYTEENTYWYQNKRSCRICNRAKTKRWQDARR